MNRFQLVFASALVAAMPFVGGLSGAAASTQNRAPQAPPAPGAPPATGTVIYDSLPVPQPPNIPSQPFQAQQTFEFGDHIRFAGTIRTATKVTVLMSAWGKQSEYPLMTDRMGWIHPIRFTLYSVVPGSTPSVESPIATVTQNFKIPWRPEADPTCAGGTAWRSDSDGQCYNGYAFNIVFDLTSLNVTLPNEIIYGIAYNTQSYGVAPLGVAGPYNSLNVGAEPVVPSVGTDVDPNGVFWNTITPVWYCDGGVAGSGTFRLDTGCWAPYVPNVRFEALGSNVVKANIRASLFGMLPTIDAKTNEQIGKAIDHIDKSLAPALWADASHLTDKGQKVFEEEKKAVEELMKVKGPIAASLMPAIMGLAHVDEQLAQTAIDEAAPGKDKDKAINEMTLAAVDMANQDCDKAIERFKKAWQFATKN